MLSRSSGMVRVEINFSKVIGRSRSRGVFQVRSGRNSHQDWEKSE
jgi:hypothetical protein